MNRPTEKDPEVIAAAVYLLHGEVIEWLDSHKSTTPSSPEEVAEVKSDLAEFIDADDGYDFARSLEKYKGWMPDRDLVEILDNAGTALWQAQRELEAKWVSAYGVRPLHALWDAVTYKGQPAEITKVDAVRGRYLARITCDNKHSLIGANECYGREQTNRRLAAGHTGALPTGLVVSKQQG